VTLGLHFPNQTGSVRNIRSDYSERLGVQYFPFRELAPLSVCFCSVTAQPRKENGLLFDQPLIQTEWLWLAYTYLLEVFVLWVQDIDPLIWYHR